MCSLPLVIRQPMTRYCRLTSGSAARSFSRCRRRGSRSTGPFTLSPENTPRFHLPYIIPRVPGPSREALLSPPFRIAFRIGSVRTSDDRGPGRRPPHFIFNPKSIFMAVHQRPQQNKAVLKVIANPVKRLTAKEDRDVPAKETCDQEKVDRLNRLVQHLPFRAWFHHRKHDPL